MQYTKFGQENASNVSWDQPFTKNKYEKSTTEKTATELQ